jgi:hypothetical protein
VKAGTEAPSVVDRVQMGTIVPSVSVMNLLGQGRHGSVRGRQIRCSGL